MEDHRAGRASVGITVTCLGVLALAGCAIQSDLMSPAGGSAASVRPDTDHAVVVFVRPGSSAGAVQAVLYDDEKLIGVSSADTAVAYQATPGPHRFMVISEAADFMTADLLPGRVYYARVAPRMGAWRERFSLLPINPRARGLDAWLREARLVTMTDKAERWDAENRASVLHKKTAYLRRWEQKPVSERPTLRPEDGVDVDQPGGLRARSD